MPAAAERCAHVRLEFAGADETQRRALFELGDCIDQNQRLLGVDEAGDEVETRRGARRRRWRGRRDVGIAERATRTFGISACAAAV